MGCEIGGRRAWRLFGRVLRRGSLSVAAFWAGAAARAVERGGCCRLRDCPLSMAAYWRVLRTLGGKNIGKCRLRAHQHPLLPPLPNLRRARSIQNLQVKTRRQRVMKRVLGDVLLPASIRDFRPKHGNRCKDFPIYGLLRASILDFRPELENHCRLFPRNSPTDAVILDLRGSI